jgi:hypothetical protein
MNLPRSRFLHLLSSLRLLLMRCRLLVSYTLVSDLHRYLFCGAKSVLDVDLGVERI